MSDTGYLDPDGVARRVHADASGLVGGLRSLIMQALHPRAMAAVADHSDFRVDFWGRLRRTSDFLMTIVFGTQAEADQAGAIVRSIHSRISGVDSFTGLPYRADEPELLEWIHLATLDSYLVAFQTYGRGRLSPAELDRYVSEMRILGESVGLRALDLPSTMGQLQKRIADFGPDLIASPAANEAMRRLMQVPLPLRLRPLWDLPAAAAVASLPLEYRQEYGLAWVAPFEPGVRLSASLLVAGLRLVLPPPGAPAAA